MANKSKYIQIYTTVAKESDAEKIAGILLNKKLSACTQIVGPITSEYQWKGKTKKTKEWLCITKTEQGHYSEVEKTIKNAHPYELPEIIAMPISKGSRRQDEVQRDRAHSHLRHLRQGHR